MGFKDALERDIRTFVSANEFGETHSFGKRALNMIIENDTETPSPLAYAEGVSTYRKIVHVHTDELGYMPEEGMVVELDGTQHIITNVEDARGIIKITLEGNVR